MRTLSVKVPERRLFERNIERAFRNLRDDGSNSLELSDEVFKQYNLDRAEAVPIVLTVLDRLSRAECEHRGDRSILWDVGLPRQGGCTLKRHFLGCLRQIIGLAEKLAANDPDRFVWAGKPFFIRHARKRRNGEYKARQVHNSFLVAELLGVLGQEEERLRNGIVRKGFTVLSHDSVTTETDSRCLLKVKRMNSVSSRVRGEKRNESRQGRAVIASAMSARKATPSATVSATRNPISATPSATISRPECIAECNTDCNTKSSDVAHPPEVDDQSPAEYVQKCEQKSASEPVNPVSQPLYPSTDEPTAAIREQEFWNDLDLIKADGQGKTMTVGEWFDNLLYDDIIEAISDHEFDLSFLTNYKHSSQLTKCCHDAVAELSTCTFSGRSTCAKIMGSAMELLRANHNTDVPKGWLPVMRALRKGGNVRSSRPQAIDYWEPPIIVPAEEALTSDHSALHAIDSGFGGNGALLQLAQQQPSLWAVIVDLARQRGIPQWWGEALEFVEAVIENLSLVPGELLKIRDKLQAKVNDLKPISVITELPVGEKHV